MRLEQPLAWPLDHGRTSGQNTSPLSKYLQTRGMDIITAQPLVEGTEEGLRECATDFEGVKCAADKLVKWANEKLQEEEECRNCR